MVQPPCEGVLEGCNDLAKGHLNVFLMLDFRRDAASFEPWAKLTPYHFVSSSPSSLASTTPGAATSVFGFLGLEGVEALTLLVYDRPSVAAKCTSMIFRCVEAREFTSKCFRLQSFPLLNFLPFRRKPLQR